MKLLAGLGLVVLVSWDWVSRRARPETWQPLVDQVVRASEQTLRASPEERQRLARLAARDWLAEHGWEPSPEGLDLALERARRRWGRAALRAWWRGGPR